MMRSGCGDFEGPLGVRLAGDVPQVDKRWWRLLGSRLAYDTGIHGLAGFPMRLQLTEVTDSQDRGGGGDPCLCHVGGRHIEAPCPKAIQVRDDGQRAPDGSDAAVERQLAKPGGITRQAPVLAGIDNGCRHREIEATALFW